MNHRRYFTFLLLILGLCVLPGCIQTFGTAVEPPQSASEEPGSVSAAENQVGILFYDDLNEARSLAAQEKKPMILFFYSPNCVFSQQMLQETFCDENVAKLSEQFVCVKIDESRQRKICEEYDVKGTPTVQFVNQQGILLQRLTAKKSPGQLLLQMQIALESIAAREQKRL
ncbi:MAG: thioredoxin family protein [Planctomycetaceae bacterium]|nr:thioredoxin family protein [Planctomycetaceae bacterium]MCL2306057.1 thioredoxin family protein [Planctomycetaceae bacterium]